LDGGSKYSRTPQTTLRNTKVPNAIIMTVHTDDVKEAGLQVDDVKKACIHTSSTRNDTLHYQERIEPKN